jgi:hypothetical protein
MIRVSIDLPMGVRYRTQPLVDNLEQFVSRDVFIGYDLPNPDLRILHNDTAVEELLTSPDGRMRTATIVYERVDGAVVINDVRVRKVMAHPDVKLWLKRNTYRDFELNNRNRIDGNLHYKTLNDLESLSVAPTSGEPPGVPVTADMAAKIRFLPVAYIDRFSALRAAPIDWSAKRQIDVNFAGTVDYEVQARDYWDEAYDKAQAATSTGLGSVVIRHRREAIRQMVELRHLRVVIGTNGALGPGLYLPMMLQTSIAVSPWGLGEYSYRDYEAILAGAVLVKPDSDHIATFAPDIYQAGKYYAPCAADFSNLYDVVRSIMSNRARAIEMAQRARADLLAANRPEQIAEYFVALFREALETPTRERISLNS